MAWIRWTKVCMPKEFGGLGIKNMEVFNLALLGKWRWRMLVEKNSEWNKMLDKLYGAEGILNRRQESVWWKDLKGLDDCLSYAQHWFSEAIRPKLGNGKSVGFWFDRWCGPRKLMEEYPNLFLVAENRSVTVAESGLWEGNSWNWRLNWTRELLPEEQQEAQLLVDALLPISLLKDTEDNWVWLSDPSRSYKVKTSYQMLMSSCSEVESNAARKKAFRRIWEAAVPSKYSAFAWRLLLNGLPTRCNLQQRGVLNQNQSSLCVFCSRENEDAAHLFFCCCVSIRVWLEVCHWTGIALHEFNDIGEHLLQHSVNTQHKKRKKLRHIVWIATVWTLWITRNNIIFRGGVLDVTVMVNHIQYLSWGWFVHRVDNNSSVTLECWCSNSLNSLSFGEAV